MNKMHIGINCYEYPPCNHGGIGSFTKDLAEALVKQGHKVTVFGFYLENILKLEKEIDEVINGVRVIRIQDSKKLFNNQLNIVYNRIRLYKLVKKLHNQTPFDIIESPESGGWLPFGLPNNISLLTRLHGGTAYFAQELNRKSSRMISFFEKQQLQTSNHIVSVSKYTAEKTLDIFKIKKNYSVIYNSIKLPADLKCVENTIEKNLIVFSGSILPKKGVEELVKSINIVCQNIPNAKFIFAGKNFIEKNGKPYTEYLKELVDKQYRSNIHFVGALNREKELFPLLCKAHICCFPSHAEAFSLAPLEAMALAKPVIYSKLHSGKEALIHMESGLLCDPRDPNDIAANILLLLENQELCKKIAKKGQERVENLFNYQKWIIDNIELYKTVIQKGKK